MKTLHVLAIETSCDDTAAAVIASSAEGGAHVLSSIISSQANLHALWGGVVPTLAAREHIRNISPVVSEALSHANLTPEDIDLIAVTAGPGLVPALTVGTQAAKTLSCLWHKPLLGIHHIEGHIYANFITSAEAKEDSIQFPLLALVVSGGHTQLILMRDHFQYEILGETQDDAVGEAFDKVAKMLGLPYPGGPQVAAQAEAISNNQFSIFNIKLPRPMIDSGDLNFSFSGLKTAVLYTLRNQSPETPSSEHIQELCHAFQEAAVDVLIAKTRQALESSAYATPRTVIIAGGVSANVRLRERMETMITEHFPLVSFRMPEFKYSLDNAAMIGAAAAYRWQSLSAQQKEQASTTWQTLEPNPNLKLIPTAE